jgi:hypothetical protein
VLIKLLFLNFQTNEEKQWRQHKRQRQEAIEEEEI